MKLLLRILFWQWSFDSGSSAASQAQQNQQQNQQQAQSYFANMLAQALGGNAAYAAAHPSPSSTWGAVQAPGMVGPSSVGGGMMTGAPAAGTSLNPLQHTLAQFDQVGGGG